MLLPGLTQGSRSSPWANCRLLEIILVLPVPSGSLPACVCAKAARARFSRDVGTNAIVRTRNVSACCAPGKLRNGNADAGPLQTDSSSIVNASGSVASSTAPLFHVRPFHLHAARVVTQQKKSHQGPICQRPGCDDPPRCSCRAPARYCSDDCRHALRRVHDRERKWLLRRTFAGQFKRRLEYQAASSKRSDPAQPRTIPVASSDASTLPIAPAPAPRVGPTLSQSNRSPPKLPHHGGNAT